MVCVFLWWTVSVCPSNSVCTHREHCLLSLFNRIGTGQMGYVGAMHRKSRRQDPLLLSPTASLPQSKCLSLSQRLWVYPAVTKHCQECTSISSSPLFFYHLLSFPTLSSRTLLLLLSYNYPRYIYTPLTIMSCPIQSIHLLLFSASTLISHHRPISSIHLSSFSIGFGPILSDPIIPSYLILSYPILFIFLFFHSYSCHIIYHIIYHIYFIISYSVPILSYPILSLSYSYSFQFFYSILSCLLYPVLSIFLFFPIMSCLIVLYFILYYTIISHSIL